MKEDVEIKKLEEKRKNYYFHIEGNKKSESLNNK